MPRPPCKADVLGPVADDPRRGKVEVKHVSRCVGHAGPRLAVLAGTSESLHDSCGMVRAIQKQVDVRTVPCQMRFDVLVHTGNVVDPVQASCDPSLVCHHCNWDAGPIEPGNRTRCPFDELNSVDRADVSVVNDYRAVAIKEDAGPQMRALLGVHQPAPSGEQRVGVSFARARRSGRTRVAKTGHWSLYHVTSSGSLAQGPAPGHKSVQPLSVIRRTLQRCGLERLALKIGRT